ncbi:MAG: hypothetical protein IJA27_09165 [Lachnospiraceae bacterium]|nr:hypothetical protein [Lachnospiraceae bacterium]
MKEDKIKRLLLLCIMAMTICFLITGCGGKKNKESGTKDGDNNTSSSFNRDDYVGLLGNEFGYEDYVSETALFSDVKDSNEYYSQIQSCAEWGIIESSSEFKPDNPVTLGFAIESSVKAIGMDDIANGETVVDEDELVSFFVNNIAKIDVSNLNAELDKETAEQIIQFAVDYRDNMEIPQICEYELMEGVKEAKGNVILNYDGTTGVIYDDSDYKVGDIIYWEASDSNSPMAAKIKSIENGVFEYETPGIEEVYASMNVSGTYDGTIIAATSASDGTNVEFGQELYDEVKGYGVSCDLSDSYKTQLLSNNVKIDKGSNYVKFIASADAKYKGSDSSANVTGTLVAEIKNIKVTLDYDTKHILNPDYVNAKVTFDTNVSSSITGEFSKSIPLGEVWINVAGPIQLRLVLTANIGANGEVSISYTTDNVLNAGYKKGAGLQKSFSSTPALDFEADVTVTAEVTALADLVIGFNILCANYSESIVNAQITTGVVAIAKTEGDLLSKEPMCTDILVYVPLKWGINQESCILTSISSKLKYKATIWDSESSKFKLHFHYEDGVRTAGDECTRGEGEEVVQESVDEQGDPFDELELFEFELIDFDFIKLESNLVMLNKNESKSIKVVTIPEGYRESDLIYEVEDSSVCSVNSGNVTAIGNGSTIVKVKTSDGVYSTSVAVTVFDDFSVEGFEPL